MEVLRSAVNGPLSKSMGDQSCRLHNTGRVGYLHERGRSADENPTNLIWSQPPGRITFLFDSGAQWAFL